MIFPAIGFEVALLGGKYAAEEPSSSANMTNEASATFKSWTIFSPAKYAV
jgi:hypothetical protein